MNQTSTWVRLKLVLPILIAGLAAVLPVCSQEPEIPTLRGNITAVQPPDGFDVAGYHVVTSPTTQFFVLHGPKEDPAKLRADLRVGTYVHIIGDKDRQAHTITARQVKVRDEGNSDTSGVGVIDRMMTPGPQPVFRADGYFIRVDADTDLHFNGDLKSIDDIGPGVWVHYEGRRDASGQLAAARLEFAHPKPSKKRDPAKLEQVTTFPSGSIIDFDGSFKATRAGHKVEDQGGDCGWWSTTPGWYPVPDVPSVQEHVRRVGMSLIPQYQRDLPADSPEKISFRFYVVEEKYVRTDLSCHAGLVLIPVSVVNRVTNENQLAAVLADGVAASLERQQARVFDLGTKGLVELAAFSAFDAAGGVGGVIVGGAVVRHQIERRMEDQRGRVALGLMADAGYDPWQAPEAWRLLNPNESPKNPAKLKYPQRAGYQLEILGLQYKPVTASTQPAAPAENATPNPNQD